jgi:hypothetical protein
MHTTAAPRRRSIVTYRSYHRTELDLRFPLLFPTRGTDTAYPISFWVKLEFLLQGCGGREQNVAEWKGLARCEEEDERVLQRVENDRHHRQACTSNFWLGTSAELMLRMTEQKDSEISR